MESRTGVPPNSRRVDPRHFSRRPMSLRCKRMGASDGTDRCQLEAECISKSHVSRILRPALLAPDIVEMVLEGRSDQALMLEKLERPLPASR